MVLSVFDPMDIRPLGLQAWVHSCSPILVSGSPLIKAIWYNCKQIRVLKAGIVNGDLSSVCLNDLAWDCLGAVSDA